MNYLNIECPNCKHVVRFSHPAGVSSEDALMLIEIDGRACRRCGTLLVPRKEGEAAL
jgi:phage FluMu protein Com